MIDVSRKQSYSGQLKDDLGRKWYEEGLIGLSKLITQIMNKGKLYKLKNSYTRYRVKFDYVSEVYKICARYHSITLWRSSLHKY
jgi:hypothetical protein